MDPISVVDAAEALGVSPRRVRQLIAAGDVPAVRVGRSWLVDGSAVHVERPAGRPWSARMAWAVLAVACGREPNGLPAPRASEAKRRFRERGLLELAPRLRSRARVRRFYVHPSVIADLSVDGRLVRGGVSAAPDVDADIAVANELEGYVRASDVRDLVSHYGLIEPHERPNVCFRVVEDDLFPFGQEAVAPPAVVAVDLLDSSDDRVRRAGEALVGELL